MLIQNEIEVCVEALRTAAEFTQYVQSHSETILPVLKQDKSPVTIADLGAQTIIHSYLKNAFHNDRMIAEESSSELPHEQLTLLDTLLGQRFGEKFNASSIRELLDWGNDISGSDLAKRTWTLDPVDGTLGFLRGQQYAICLALIDQTQNLIELGFMACPNISQLNLSIGVPHPLFLAIRGQGAFMLDSESKRHEIRCQESVEIEDAVFCMSVEAKHSSQPMQQKLLEHLKVKSEPLRLDSQCKYALLALGAASAYIRWPYSTTYQEKIWDHAAGTILVQEAGGVVTDLDGLPLDFSKGKYLSLNRGIVASANKKLHEQILCGIKSINSVK